ncbi:DUF1998 domain-containing protein [Pseudoxanthomonas mexicana]|uniref:DUF1998 domain-containing protein n=1 Tax=Pseudoxanthomonas mexicana TaxID=128785 RepID=UPI0007809210|nr:DUF1998 domain-containing protein [Pseudoxanthomonas mexicana]
MGKRSIRQGQLVAPFGVGSIIDIGQESFVMADISRWGANGTHLIEDSHLERKLKRPIRTPVASESLEPVAIHRFPRWHFCPRCRLMRMVTGQQDLANGYGVPKCANPKCKGELTPMGFVAACKNGHMSDVDWHWWAHSSSAGGKGPCSRQGAQMWFETTGQGGGDWSAISVRCSCGAKRNFVGLVQVEAPMGMHCKGGQPWQLNESGCGEPLWVYRRAASNLHFPKSISALDLLPIDGQMSAADLADAWQTHPSWDMIKSLDSAQVAIAKILMTATAMAEQLAGRYGCDAGQALDALARALRPESNAVTDEDDDLTDAQAAILHDEWETLSGRRDISSRFLDIKRTMLPDDWPPELIRTIKAISMVRRLREVRALLGFRRLTPDEQRAIIPVDLGSHPLGWYPGVEAWGEGIFLQLDADAVREWESNVKGGLERRLSHLASTAAGLGWDASMASPRFLLLHSLAHAMIRRLSFDAGYSASSIRERIYAGSVGSKMCGILLYTADGDSEGSLGGLVRMGEPKRLGALLEAALLDVSWCSADPVCKESDRQGIGGMNAASCHACMLVSETSCAFNNSLLDRRALVGIGDMEPFFKLDKLVEYQS